MYRFNLDVLALSKADVIHSIRMLYVDPSARCGPESLLHALYALEHLSSSQPRLFRKPR